MEAGSEARVRLDILSIAKRGGWPKIRSGILYNLTNQGCSEATQAGELVRTGHLQLAETGPVISTSKRLRQLMKTSVKQLTTAFIMATGFCLAAHALNPFLLKTHMATFPSIASHTTRARPFQS